MSFVNVVEDETINVINTGLMSNQGLNHHKFE